MIQGLARALRARFFVFERAMPDTAPQQACLVRNGAHGTGLNTGCGDSPNAFCPCEGYLRCEALGSEAKWSTKARLKRLDIQKALIQTPGKSFKSFFLFPRAGKQCPPSALSFCDGGLCDNMPSLRLVWCETKRSTKARLKILDKNKTIIQAPGKSFKSFFLLAFNAPTRKASPDVWGVEPTRTSPNGAKRARADHGLRR